MSTSLSKSLWHISSVSSADHIVTLSNSSPSIFPPVWLHDEAWCLPGAGLLASHQREHTHTMTNIEQCKKKERKKPPKNPRRNPVVRSHESTYMKSGYLNLISQPGCTTESMAGKSNSPQCHWGALHIVSSAWPIFDFFNTKRERFSREEWSFLIFGCERYLMYFRD